MALRLLPWTYLAALLATTLGAQPAVPPPWPAAFPGAVPTHHGDTGLFALPGAYTLASGAMSASAVVLGADERGTRGTVTAGYGLGPRLEVFGNARHRSATEDWTLALGAKWQFRDDRAGDRIALALRGMVEPSADPGARLDLVASTMHYQGVATHAAVGVDHAGDDAPDVLAFGAGLQWQVARQVDVELEVTGGHPFEGRRRAVLDVVGGLTVTLARSAFVRAGLSYAARGPDHPGRDRVGLRASIGWHPGPAPARRVEPR